jgi:predicted DNA-binding transcriptional regulator AlpA
MSRKALLATTAPFNRVNSNPKLQTPPPVSTAARRTSEARAHNPVPRKPRKRQKRDTGSDDDDDPPSRAEKTYLTAMQLRKRYGGRSHMWIERRLLSDPTFPRPAYFGRFRFWALDEIEAWERAAIAARGNNSPEAA